MAATGELRLANAAVSCYVNTALQVITTLRRLFDCAGVRSTGFVRWLKTLRDAKWSPEATDVVERALITKTVNEAIADAYVDREEDPHELLLRMIDCVERDPMCKGAVAPLTTIGITIQRTCRSCGHARVRHETLRELNVPIPPDRDRFDILDMFKAYFAEETIPDARCDVDDGGCGLDTEAVRRQYITAFPHYLVIFVVRHDNANRKLHQAFDAGHVVTLRENRYKLVAATTHLGHGTGHGHHMAYGRVNPLHETVGRWRRYNDAEVTEVPAEELMGEARNFYLLVYERV